MSISAEAAATERMIQARRDAYFRGVRERDGEQFLFSADAAGSSTTTASAADKLVPIAGAAIKCGLSEDDMRERITYRCKLQVIDGELVARQGDLQELANAGVIPKPSEVEAAAKGTAAADRPATDPTTEAKTARMADALAIDVAGVKPAESVPTTPQQFQTATATQRQSRRLGAPRRWGQNQCSDR